MTKGWRSRGETVKLINAVPAAKHGGGGIMLGGCFAASCSGTLHGMMKKEDYLQIIQIHLESTARCLKLGYRVQIHIKASGMAFPKLRCQPC